MCIRDSAVTVRTRRTLAELQLRSEPDIELQMLSSIAELSLGSVLVEVVAVAALQTRCVAPQQS
eukprot:2546191-Rhodomonas_salina.1